ncbi:MAG: D-tyrosyl-tRNA(Tyr) deacylase [Bacteroidales bacterium]|nr:D-tyrosyl-tRNA(Tyr) deacylase [Bacteroidales bacterium]
MRLVVQRVSSSSVTVDNQIVGEIGKGIMILVGFEKEDTIEDLEWAAKKVSQLRIFDDENGVMNLSLNQVGGEVLVISQFTLFASTKKGNRPSYIYAATPNIAIPLYEEFKKILAQYTENGVKCGIFGADMKVALVNDGPVTIIIDTKNKQ